MKRSRRVTWVHPFSDVMGADMSTSFNHLFSPFDLNGLRLENRLVMLPHMTFYGTKERTPSERHHYYYLERARGGVGLIITESQYVHESSAVENGVDAANRAGMLLWRETIDRVHDFGTRMFAQLTHHGIQGAASDSYLPLLSPSAIPDATVRETPKAMDADDMREVIDSFRAAVGNARAAGFDGVELKVGHDGMLRAFLSPYFNRRQDEYGGTRENRIRFVLDVLRAVRAEIGRDTVLGIRFCMHEQIPGGYTLEDAQWYSRAFGQSGLLDYISSDMGTWMSVDFQVPPMSVPQGFAREAFASIKAHSALPVIAFGRIKDPVMAEDILAQGHADLIGMARQLIADPEFAHKVREGRLEDIRPCVACNQECVGRLVRSQPIGCVHNPAAGHEKALGTMTLTRTPTPKKVVVVGGGPTGLKAAEVAAMRGHQVTLMEKGPTLGGQVAYAAKAPGHHEWGEIVTHLAGRLVRLGVRICLNTTATPESLASEAPDAVVIAAGAGPGPLPFAVKGAMPVYTEWQILAEDATQLARVALLDMGVRFEAAALAETLAARGSQVTWIAPTFTVGAEIEPTSLIPLRRRLAEHGTVCLPETIILEVYDDTVLTLNVLTGQVQPLGSFDAVVIVGNKMSENALLAAVKAQFSEVYTGGDCVAPRHVAIAIREGEKIGRAL